MRHPPNDSSPTRKHHEGMETLRAIAVNTARAAWMRAVWPSLVLTVAITLDQYTRGPSISGMLLTYLLS